jgi:hypothetical protein
MKRIDQVGLRFFGVYPNLLEVGLVRGRIR